MIITDQAQYYKEAITTLLVSEKLPVVDLPDRLDNFLVAKLDTAIIGAIGLEIYDRCGLLRSLVVAPAYRNVGIAAKLINRIEALSELKGLRAIYLLTETAPGYFEKKGFTRVSREDVPDAMQASSEFSHLCPACAIAMKKNLNQ